PAVARGELQQRQLQPHDLRFALEVARRSFTDPTKAIALVGFSFWRRSPRRSPPRGTSRVAFHTRFQRSKELPQIESVGVLHRPTDLTHEVLLDFERLCLPPDLLLRYTHALG